MLTGIMYSGLRFFSSSGFADMMFFNFFTVNMLNLHNQSYFRILNQKLLCNDAKEKKTFNFASVSREQICGLAREKKYACIPHLNSSFLSQAIFYPSQACYQNPRWQYKEDVVHIYNGILLSHKKRIKFCHLQQHGWTWRVLCLVK